MRYLNLDKYKKYIKSNIYNLLRVNDYRDDNIDLRLNKNERLCPFNEILFKEFKNNITWHYLSDYGDLRDIYSQLSNFLNVKSSQIMLSAGADLSIKAVYESCIRKGDSIIMPSLCYAMYGVYAHMFEGEIKKVAINRKWDIEINKIFSCVDKKTKLCILESPSGSIGNIYTKENLEKCAKFLFERDIILLIDETYLGFDKRYSSFCGIIEKYSNVLIVRSFSKMPGLAGLRIGFLIGNENLIKYISKTKPMHEINNLAAYAVSWVIKYPQLFDEYYKVLDVSKKYLIQQLENLDIQSVNTYANFILVYLPDRGKTKNLGDKLKKFKILIKDSFDEPFLKGWVRLTVGSMSDSKKLINSIKNVFKK